MSTNDAATPGPLFHRMQEPAAPPESNVQRAKKKLAGQIITSHGEEIRIDIPIVEPQNAAPLAATHRVIPEENSPFIVEVSNTQSSKDTSVKVTSKAYSPEVSKRIQDILYEGEQEEIEQLFNEGLDLVNWRGPEGQSAIHLAQDAETITKLVSLGIDINAKDNNGETALHYAVKATNISQIIALLNAGADMYAEDNQGQTPAMATLVARDTIGYVKYLKSRGLDINAKNSQGTTCLQMLLSISPFNASKIKDLLELGADVNTMSQNGKTILQLARDNEAHDLLYTLITTYKFVPEGDDLYICLATACTLSSLDAFKLLVEEYHIDLSKPDSNGNFVTHLACAFGVVDILKYVIEEKGLINLINTRDSEGNTPLMIACECRKAEAALYLLSMNADVHAVNSEGHTAIEIARSVITSLQPMKALIQGLLLAGAKEQPNLAKEIQTFMKLNPGKKVILADLLKKSSATCEIFDEKFSELELKGLLKNIDFSGITFRDCTFHRVDFSQATFRNCVFTGCQMADCIFYSVEFTHCRFTGCNIMDSVFEHIEAFFDVRFEQSNLEYTGFNECLLANVTLSTCKLSGTNFYDSQAKYCEYKDCNLENCLLYALASEASFTNCSGMNVHTKPVVAIAWCTQSPGEFARKATLSLKAAGANPMKFNYRMASINPELLDTEVKDYLKSIKANAGSDVSIPQQLLQLADNDSDRSHSEVKKLIARASRLSDSVSAILIPGGMDIEPELYGEERLLGTECEPDFRRSILEFAIIRSARQRGLPLMGICRGSQVGNVFHGGKLAQHIEGQLRKEQVLKPTIVNPTMGTGILRSIVGNGFKGYSAHHQASQIIGKNLELILEHEGVTKAIEGTVGAPLLLLQFHPEYLTPLAFRSKDASPPAISEENYAIFPAFLKAASQYSSKRELLKGVQSNSPRKAAYRKPLSSDPKRYT